jgi:predicted dehydrogenase
MKNFAIIGAGQLGSRHLQGMLNYKRQAQKIYVIDPSLDSLKISKVRASEIEHNHQLFFQQDWDNLPETFNVVIVATSANVREQVINLLLSQYKVEYLILEKVLFTDFMAYQRVSELLKSKSMKTWVNHPRRMFISYHELKNIIGENFIGTFQLTGGNWGLGCNGLHFLDLFEYLSGSKLEIIDADWVDSEMLESKRKGFVEFTGTLKGKLANGSNFQITSLKGEQSAGTIAIFDGVNRFIIQESGAPAIYHLKNPEAFKQNTIPFTMEFQSSLTTKLLEDLLSSGNCNLPTYEEAKQTHELFISALLQAYNNIQKNDTHILPIT